MFWLLILMQAQLQVIVAIEYTHQSVSAAAVAQSVADLVAK